MNSSNNAMETLAYKYGTLPPFQRALHLLAALQWKPVGIILEYGASLLSREKGATCS